MDISARNFHAFAKKMLDALNRIDIWKYMYGARHGTMALTTDDLADCLAYNQVLPLSMKAMARVTPVNTRKSDILR